MTEVKKRGRKPLPPEVRVERKNISLDVEAQTALHEVVDKLEQRLGFRPTLTQTILWLARNSGAL